MATEAAVKVLGSWGASRRKVRLVRRDGRLIVEWYEQGLRREKGWPDAKGNVAIARTWAKVFAEERVLPRKAPTVMPEPSLTPPPEGAEPQGPRTKPTLVRQPGRPVIRIYGKPFHVEHEGDVFYLVHDQWSLIGSGSSLAAAYKDLLFEASEVAPIYMSTPESQLDAEGSRFAKFLVRLR